MDAIKLVENDLSPVNEFPTFGAGDTSIVSYQITEGNKERIQQVQGVVIQ
jgi:large subunit ribosomal protein L19